MAEAPTESVEEFARRTGIDDRSLQGLHDLEPQDQLVAMDIVNQQQCKNPSAVTWRAVTSVRTRTWEMRIEYLHRHLDERARDALTALSHEEQEHIAMKTDIAKVRNLSAIVWSQIKLAGGNRRGPPVQEHWVPPQPQRGVIGRADGASRRGAIIPAPPPQRGAAIGRHDGADRHNWPERPAWPAPPAPARDRVDYGAPSRQRSAGGNSWAAPSARADYGGSRARSRSRSARRRGIDFDDTIRDFAARLGLDAKVMEAIADLSPEAQHIVRGLVDKKVATKRIDKPSAYCWSIVKLVRDSPAEAKLDYLRQEVDEKAFEALDKLPEEVQNSILSSIDVSTSRNVSALIWSMVKKQLNGGPVESREAPRKIVPLPRPSYYEDTGGKLAQGDLIPEPPRARPSAAPNVVKPSTARPQQQKASSKPSLEAEFPPSFGDAVTNLEEKLDDRCLAEFKTLSEQDQLEIAEQVVDMESCRNPSAYVWRIVRAKRGGGSKGHGR
eukprot:gnl/TRDRNA2_/TRDRNA2_173677_c3_seq1.p1 gnl/TRDRNA2_/TRDRNA2_173677_c3~~gnl/TRDRNA2_/TRDRNA2_173677_c3_seq1.p1  ORF type:complete len:519 (+),score=98.03 gnl/TRDRNA2_/TRDRNA2_173677_c3_seq1:67-1557(+)